MGLTGLVTPFPWSRYSRKLIAKIDNPRSAGFFTPDESEARSMRLVESVAGRVQDGNVIKFYWLVDKDDGIIVDAKFQAFGQSALIGAAEAACELLVGKNYDQAKRINADLIDKQVRDKADIAAFPPETYPHLNLILEAMEMAADQCTDLPLAATYVAPPVPSEIGEVIPGGYPGWKELTLKENRGHRGNTRPRYPPLYRPGCRRRQCSQSSSRQGSHHQLSRNLHQLLFGHRDHSFVYPAGPAGQGPPRPCRHP